MIPLQAQAQINCTMERGLLTSLKCLFPHLGKGDPFVRFKQSNIFLCDAEQKVISSSSSRSHPLTSPC